MNGRRLIKKACAELNASNVFSNQVSVQGIDTATGDALNSIVNAFMDQIESVPERYEVDLPDVVISTYNALVDNDITFEVVKDVKSTINIRDLDYRRTKFN